jgi:hypothetical protein
MDIVYRLQGMEFEWDENKAGINIQKHGVTLEESAEVFFDPFYQTGDAPVNDSEERDFHYRVYFLPAAFTGCVRGVRQANANYLRPSCNPRRKERL